MGVTEVDSALTYGVGGAGGMVLLGAVIRTFWSWFMKTRLATAADNAEVSVIRTLQTEVGRLQVIVETQNTRINEINTTVQMLQNTILYKDRLLIEMLAVIKASSESELKVNLLNLSENHNEQIKTMGKGSIYFDLG